MYINGSVGTGGINKNVDVKFIQDMLSQLALQDMRLDTLKADGACGPKTKEAIGKFQQYIVKLKKPDQRIDPNGRSEKTLVAHVNNLDSTLGNTLDNNLANTLAKKYGLVKAGAQSHNPGIKQIIYREHARKVLTGYTENVIKLAMNYAGINQCDISSTLRTFDDQARIMYNNCAAYSNATSVSTLRAARGWGYKAAGQAVETVYFAKKSEDKADCLAAMKEKITELYSNGQKVSLHCVSEADYKLRNVLDIPYSSVHASKQKAFELALMGMTENVLQSRHPAPVKSEIYIDKLIIEDRCWHLEIPQTGKKITGLNDAGKAATPANKPQVGVNTLEASLNLWLRCFQRFY